MNLTRKQKSKLNKAAFRAGAFSRAHGCALSPGYSKPKRKARSAAPKRGGASSYASLYAAAMRGSTFSEGKEPNESNVMLFTDAGTPRGGRAGKKNWSVASGSMKSALASIEKQVATLADKYEMDRFYETLHRAAPGVYYVGFGS